MCECTVKVVGQNMGRFGKFRVCRQIKGGKYSLNASPIMERMFGISTQNPSHTPRTANKKRFSKEI
jgi:hypothetical protein